MTIVPATAAFEGIEAAHMSYCYLHGKLQDEVGYDIFGFKRDTLSPKVVVDEDGFIESLPEGVYPCTFKDGQDCTFFYWSCNEYRHRGLVVYNDDEEAFDYALECYNEKAFSL